MFIDLYDLQNVPPSNINRDDTGSPKVARYGGVLRSRVSSQAWKRAMREMFPSLLDSSRLGVRTKNAVSLIRDSIIAKRPDLIEDAETLAKCALSATGVNIKESDRAGKDKGTLSTDYLIFIAHREIAQLADVAITWQDAGVDAASKPTAAMKKEIDAVFHGVQAVDIALFGRMLADAPDLNTDASAQVAHAISVDQITPEYDYFTAVDDCASDDNAGAAMLDTVGFNSSTLYRYATLNVNALHDQLQDAAATVEGAAAFVEAFIRSMPTGKQNTFANRTLPTACVVMIRDDQPINVVDAFEDPVRPQEGTSISRQAAARLGRKLAYVQSAYGEQPRQAWNITADEPVPELDAVSVHVSFPELKAELKTALTQALSKE
ncbi:type I-E CRISPR-associated protein Cas7/Cse4/CasC [Bifidobacterium avesanii]|uniref:Type I-E CRISPR-associated protein Cas7/Cse4/CasC n=1 Tax=Bifidobacterium avesanii TaxID=1798157 RepID=A0A7K3TKM1_9BIFI|nr:type I-E CRISPR-associated protein Cas7/Cse4/CasC [Bifidobacterium avesanii]KAB8287925.1 type I-E CRISPR-associated protein Cas7/Cse4/CasC [Bifidobacterium avesanii]NEG79214.1 type I-E CRISPR-associated protein Cas7/Cse4/CasC [Bifidobacterium avesanii]